MFSNWLHSFCRSVPRRGREATVDFHREGSSVWLAANGHHQYTFDISSHFLVHSSIDWISSIHIRQLRSSLAFLV